MSSKTITVSVFMMLAWAAVAEPVAYVSIVRDHNGKVTEKTGEVYLLRIEDL